ncbi:hypothetical protein AMS68_003586 [Peltaster fructicola]|uniref:Shugoshin C-terminal domain-containing protein n=1 Tax=Peltaster fructicola TaxID=286661 RepID=A0A6H0XTX7_9PEZI|nr:hypothetical protein AMS68_003586 [Peltaster fructicola]
MARLNEAPAPSIAPSTRVPNGEDQPTAESFEAVKRSLMRQNRNLARSHSAQSLQIRTLSTQISSLLANNTALSEENIRLRKQLTEAHDDAMKRGMKNLKAAMNEHLRGIAALVDSFDANTDHALSPQVSPETRKSICLEGMQFRDRPSLREIMSETQMPTIQEMPALAEEEAPRLSSASGDSIDLGPPPVVRFDDEALDQPPEEPTRDIDDEPVKHSINVDTRRKRKESLGSGRRRSTLISPLLDLEKTPSSLKVGAKRKISDRDREDVADDRDDVFQFSRKSSTEEKNCEVLSIGAQPATQTTIRRPARKVLGEKSTNFSPKKVRVSEEKGDKAESKPSRDASRRSSRQSKGSIIPILQDVGSLSLPVDDPPALAVVEVDLLPKTPAASQILSPVSSEPACRGVGKADTPPPGDISISSSTTSLEGARPSRRARAAVNYAEPSLVAKMRRPGKEMLDALSGLQDPRNVMSTSRRASEDVMVKSLFKSELSTDSRAQNTRSPLIRKPDEATEEEVDLSPVDTQPSLSLAALMAGTKSLADTKSAPEELGIFDFEDTSPPESPEQMEIKIPDGIFPKRQVVGTSVTTAATTVVSTTSVVVTMTRRRSPQAVQLHPLLPLPLHKSQPPQLLRPLQRHRRPHKPHKPLLPPPLLPLQPLKRQQPPPHPQRRQHKPLPPLASTVSGSASNLVVVGSSTIDRSTLTGATTITSALLALETEAVTSVSTWTSDGQTYSSTYTTSRVVSSTTGYATATIDPVLSSDNSGSGSSLSPHSSAIIGGVVGGVGGAILLGGLAFVAWRLWGKKRGTKLPQDDYYGNETLAKDDNTDGTERYRTGGQGANPPMSVNTASNF